MVYVQHDIHDESRETGQTVHKHETEGQGEGANSTYLNAFKISSLESRSDILEVIIVKNSLKLIVPARWCVCVCVYVSVCVYVCCV